MNDHWIYELDFIFSTQTLIPMFCFSHAPAILPRGPSRDIDIWIFHRKIDHI